MAASILFPAEPVVEDTPQDHYKILKHSICNFRSSMYSMNNRLLVVCSSFARRLPSPLTISSWLCTTKHTLQTKIEGMGVLVSPLALMLNNVLLPSKWQRCVLTTFMLPKHCIASTFAQTSLLTPSIVSIMQCCGHVASGSAVDRSWFCLLQENATKAMSGGRTFMFLLAVTK
jgi:hypothetical protein